MNRQQLHDAIFELADDEHMLAYALGAALVHLELDAVGKVFDQVADHHEVRAGRTATERVAAAHSPTCQCDACAWTRRARKRSGYVGS